MLDLFFLEIKWRHRVMIFQKEYIYQLDFVRRKKKWSWLDPDQRHHVMVPTVNGRRGLGSHRSHTLPVPTLQHLPAIRRSPQKRRSGCGLQTSLSPPPVPTQKIKEIKRKKKEKTLPSSKDANLQLVHSLDSITCYFFPFQPGSYGIRSI